MANTKQFLVLMVLSISTAMAIAASSPLEEEKSFLPPNFLNPGKITQCWASIIGIEGCAKDVLASFLSLRIQLSSECCNAIEGIGESCFLNIFSNPPFNPFFPPLLKAFCKTPPSPSVKAGLLPPSPVKQSPGPSVA